MPADTSGDGRRGQAVVSCGFARTGERWTAQLSGRLAPRPTLSEFWQTRCGAAEATEKKLDGIDMVSKAGEGTSVVRRRARAAGRMEASGYAARSRP
jgi:hypothetical protein